MSSPAQQYLIIKLEASSKSIEIRKAIIHLDANISMY
jgi:hypothetical protein